MKPQGSALRWGLFFGGCEWLRAGVPERESSLSS